MTKLLFASLLATAFASFGTAAAQPTPPTPPGPPQGRQPPPLLQCTKTDLLFEEQVKFEGDVREHAIAMPTFDVKLYAGGMWERTDVDAKHATTSSSGCLSKDQLAKVTAALDSAKWKVTVYQVTCAARGVQYMSYAVRGKHVWDDHVCGDHDVDEASIHAVAEIQKIVDAATKPQLPPCCKK
jgi:hypothetical protein